MSAFNLVDIYKKTSDIKKYVAACVDGFNSGSFNKRAVEAKNINAQDDWIINGRSLDEYCRSMRHVENNDLKKSGESAQVAANEPVKRKQELHDVLSEPVAL